MLPVLFKLPEWLPLLGGKAIHTYGLMAALGFLAGMLWIRYESKRIGLNPNKMMDLFFYVIVAVIIGSRLFYVFASVPRWWEDPMVFFRFWEGGLVFYGGLIGAILTSVWYTRRHHLSFFKVADVFAPGIALGHMFGRLGCFAAGCCYGRRAPHDSFFSVIFPHTEYSIAPTGYPVYASQLFEATGELVIFLFLFFFRKKKKFNGELFLVYLILYSILRSVLEIYRGDSIRGFVIEGVLSIAQVISILWILIAIGLWIWLSRNSQKKVA